MDFLRRHWFDIGIILAIPISIFLILTWKQNLPLQNILWISLIALFIHQFEEYRYPGNFYRMLNTVLYKSDSPDRYPLNSNTALVVNVLIAWLFYFAAAIFFKQAIWLGIGTMLISVGNFLGHSMLFNFKGKTLYNPGMISSILLFLPISIMFYYLLVKSDSASLTDWIIGIILGIILNVVGVMKTIDWLKDKNTKYIF